MERELAFGIPEIEEMKEAASVKEAYRTLLKIVDPAEDPERFRRVRETYRKLNGGADGEERLNTLNELARMMCEVRRCRQAVEVCDRMLMENERYYPALLTRQEANYTIRNGQQVIDDYYRAVEIRKDGFRTYLLAAKVFFYYELYEEANGVLEHARENQTAFSDEMRLYEAKLLRKLADSDEAREKALKLLSELEENPAEPGDERADLADRSEVLFEMALLYRDCRKNEEALHCLDRALEENPGQCAYYLERGNLWLELNEYQLAIDDYASAEPAYQQVPVLYYNRGLCYEAQGLEALAVEEFEKVIALQGAYRDACDRVEAYYQRVSDG